MHYLLTCFLPLRHEQEAVWSETCQQEKATESIFFFQAQVSINFILICVALKSIRSTATHLVSMLGLF